LVGFTVYCYPAFTGFVLVLTFHADQVEAKVTKQTDYRVAQRVSKVITVLNPTPNHTTANPQVISRRLLR